VQYTRTHKLAAVTAVLAGRTNYHDSEINVGLYPRVGRTPTGVTTRAHAHVTNTAGYVQDNLSFWRGRPLAGQGIDCLYAIACGAADFSCKLWPRH